MTEVALIRSRRIRNAFGGFVAAIMMIVTTAVLGATSGFAATSTVDIGGGSLQFVNTIKIGQNATFGFAQRYNGVASANGQTIDAIVSVKTLSSGLTINNVDRVSSTNNGDLWSNFQIPSGGGSATYNVSFVATGTNDPVNVKNLRINVGDVDASQYVQFSGVQSYILASNTALSAQTNATVPAVPVGSVRFADTADQGALDTDQRYWTQVEYGTPISTVDVTLGSTKGGSALFQVAFSSAGWSNQTTTTPVPQNVVSYTVSYDGNGSTAGNPPSSTTQNGGVAHTVAGNSGTLTKSNGAVFDGWNNRRDGLGVRFDAADTVTPTTDMVLYAMWIEPITVTYYANGATGGTAPAAVTSTTGAQTIATQGTLVKDGYSFVGWNTVADGSGIPYQPGQVFQPSANNPMYAQWVALPTVPANTEITIDVPVGQVIEGGEVPYVVQDLKPGTSWTINANPDATTGSSDAIELDAGVVPSDGVVIGSTVVPMLPAGEYELEFLATDVNGTAIEISLGFVVGQGGLLASIDADDSRGAVALAKTGADMDVRLAQLLPMGAVAIASLVIGAALMILRRAKRRVTVSTHR